MKTVEELVAALQTALASNLVSAVLFGSAVSGDTTKEYSDIDLFLLLNDTGQTAIAPALPLLRQWLKKGNKAPLLFSSIHFERAADVFAIEFADIKAQHRILHGTNPFENVIIDLGALRHQLEFELRANLLRLRRFYLEKGESVNEFGPVLAQSLSTFSTLFRTTLRLIGKPVPAVRQQTWTALNEHVGLDMAALEKIWDLRAGSSKLTTQTTDDLYYRLVRSIESVVDFVDAQIS